MAQFGAPGKRPPHHKQTSGERADISTGVSAPLKNVPGGQHRQNRGAHLKFESGFNVMEWEAAPVVLAEIEGLFGQGCLEIHAGLMDFYKDDPLPQRLFYELKRHYFIAKEKKGRRTEGGFVQFEGKKAPETAARLLRHYVRLCHIPSDFGLVPWAAHLMRRMAPTDQKRIMADRLIKQFAGAVHKRIATIKKGNLTFLMKFDLTEIAARKTSFDYYEHWLTTKVSDPVAYLENLPDGACSLEQDPVCLAPVQDELLLILEDLENQRFKMGLMHGSRFDKLPVTEQIRLALGADDAVRYEELLQEKTDDPAVRDLEDAEDDGGRDEEGDGR